MLTGRDHFTSITVLSKAASFTELIFKKKFLLLFHSRRTCSISRFTNFIILKFTQGSLSQSIVTGFKGIRNQGASISKLYSTAM